MSWTLLSGFLPVMLIVLAGYGLRASGVLPRPAWAGVNTLNYRVLLPALMFVTLARADYSAPGALTLTALSAGGCLVVAAIALATARVLRLDRRVAASLLGTATIWNIVLVLTLASAMFGPDSADTAILIIVPGAIIGTLITRQAVTRPGTGIRPLVLLTDPVIVSSLAGLVASLTPLADWPLVLRPLDTLAAASMGIIVLAIGAGLDFEALRGRVIPLIAAALIRSLLSPLVFLGIGLLAGLSGTTLALVVLTASAPTAAFVFALVAAYDGEHGLTAGMITASVLASAITAPVFVALALSL